VALLASEPASMSNLVANALYVADMVPGGQILSEPLSKTVEFVQTHNVASENSLWLDPRDIPMPRDILVPLPLPMMFSSDEVL
jgi:hypothetical protein